MVYKSSEKIFQIREMNKKTSLQNYSNSNRNKKHFPRYTVLKAWSMLKIDCKSKNLVETNTFFWIF